MHNNHLMNGMSIKHGHDRQSSRRREREKKRINSRLAIAKNSERKYHRCANKARRICHFFCAWHGNRVRSRLPDFHIMLSFTFNALLSLRITNIYVIFYGKNGENG